MSFIPSTAFFTARAASLTGFSASFTGFSSGSLGSGGFSFFSLGSFGSFGSLGSLGPSGTAAEASTSEFSALAFFALDFPLLLAFDFISLVAPPFVAVLSSSFFSFLSFLPLSVSAKALSATYLMSISMPGGGTSGPLESAALRSSRTIPLERACLSTPVPISMAFCIEASAPLGICKESRTCARVTNAHGQSGCSVKASLRSAKAPGGSAFSFSRERRQSIWATSSGCVFRWDSSKDVNVSSIACCRTSALSSRRIANFTLCTRLCKSFRL
mmetsp:Transcript_132476/g.314056  ORF Transcript_132476/g.314056 Transcript_132476/m.314056 type:complete len:272 (-) Transcript_132476:349-1164(-)